MQDDKSIADLISVSLVNTHTHRQIHRPTTFDQLCY